MVSAVWAKRLRGVKPRDMKPERRAPRRKSRRGKNFEKNFEKNRVLVFMMITSFLL
jgi:hypothetical protein